MVILFGNGKIGIFKFQVNREPNPNRLWNRSE